MHGLFLICDSPIYQSFRISQQLQKPSSPQEHIFKRVAHNGTVQDPHYRYCCDHAARCRSSRYPRLEPRYAATCLPVDSDFLFLHAFTAQFYAFTSMKSVVAIGCGKLFWCLVQIECIAAPVLLHPYRKVKGDTPKSTDKHCTSCTP